jgi:hypothetical protein
VSFRARSVYWLNVTRNDLSNLKIVAVSSRAKAFRDACLILHLCQYSFKRLLFSTAIDWAAAISKADFARPLRQAGFVPRTTFRGIYRSDGINRQVYWQMLGAAKRTRSSASPGFMMDFSLSGEDDRGR